MAPFQLLDLERIVSLDHSKHFFNRLLGEKARSLLTAMLERQKAALPPNDPRLAGTMAQVALAYLTAGDYDRAVPLARVCLEIREKAMPGHWLTENARSMLGGALCDQKKCAEAEPLLIAACEGMGGGRCDDPASGEDSSDRSTRATREALRGARGRG